MAKEKEKPTLTALVHPAGAVSGFSKDGQDFTPDAEGAFLVPPEWAAELCETLGLVPKPEKLRTKQPE